MGIFLLTEEDLEKTAYIVPPYPVMTYTWQELLRLSKVLQCILLFTTLVFVFAFGFAVYMVGRVFIGDWQHSLLYSGTYGFVAGIVYAIFAAKLLQSCIKLLSVWLRA